MHSTTSRYRKRRSWLRVLVALVVAIPVVVVGQQTARAVQIPETIAERKPVQVGPVSPGFPIDYLGVTWDTTGGPGAAVTAEVLGEPYGAVRFLSDGAWGPWIPLAADDAQRPGSWGSRLVPGDAADAYQIRGITADAVSPVAVAINTTDGPLVTVGHRPSVSALANCRSRADWGADESIRFVGGVETWPAEFEPVQALTVHHTATANNDSDPAATMRAIYRYHTIDRGWGDIAYQYLIDESGRVYEGRWSGSTSKSCISEGGDGSDFGHDTTDPGSPTWGQLVTGGHTYNYNQGNLGVALLGDFTNVAPTQAARSAVVASLADFATRHGLDPLGQVHYVNPTWNTAVDIDTISGHRDWPSPAGDTSCPGDTFYPTLPDVRLEVAALMGYQVPQIAVSTIGYVTSGGKGGKDLTVNIGLAEPISGASITAAVHGPDGVIEKTVTTDGAGVASIFIRNHVAGCYFTDLIGVETPGRVWDGVTPANQFCDGATTTTTTSTTSTTTTTVAGTLTIDGFNPPSMPAGTTFNAIVTGSGFVDGATVTFSGGAGPTPTASVAFVSDTELDLVVVTRDGGPPRDRVWDVVVTDPDGSSATLAGGLTLTSP